MEHFVVGRWQRAPQSEAGLSGHALFDNVFLEQRYAAALVAKHLRQYGELLWSNTLLVDRCFLIYGAQQRTNTIRVELFDAWQEPTELTFVGSQTSAEMNPPIWERVNLISWRLTFSLRCL